MGNIWSEYSRFLRKGAENRQRLNFRVETGRLEV